MFAVNFFVLAGFCGEAAFSEATGEPLAAVPGGDQFIFHAFFGCSSASAPLAGRSLGAGSGNFFGTGLRRCCSSSLLPLLGAAMSWESSPPLFFLGGLEV